MKHALRCRCGTLKGHVDATARATRLVCYCKDCQAFAHFLGRPGDILDPLGGTDIVATRGKCVTFTEGVDALACMSLSDKGLLRWYASCCRTPIGNTPRSFKMSHVGLIGACLADPSTSLQRSFGAVRMHTGTQSARGTPKSTALGNLAAIARVMRGLLRARLDGSYKRTPFFDIDTGTPVATPKVLDPEERSQLMQAV